ncbi:lysine transporter LysE, partial [Pseudomonas putida]
MGELLAVALITVLAVISPGADFAMVTRSSYAFGRRSGLLAALGIACGVQVHVVYTVLGVAVLISQSPGLFMAMKVVGAGYLIYLGYRSLRTRAPVALEGAVGVTGRGAC